MQKYHDHLTYYCAQRSEGDSEDVRVIAMMWGRVEKIIMGVSKRYVGSSNDIYRLGDHPRSKDLGHRVDFFVGQERKTADMKTLQNN